MTRALILTFSVVLLGSAPALADEQPQAVLGGENVMTGSAAGYALVRIAQQWNANDVTFELHGGGVLRGLTLTPVPGGSGPSLRALETGAEANPMRSGSAGAGGDPQSPGTYRLYLYTDGEPATGILRIPALSGRIELTPDHPVGFQSEPIRPLGQSGRKIWSGARVTISAPGDVIYWQTWKFASGQQAEYGLCNFLPGQDSSDAAFEHCGDRQSLPLPEALWSAPGSGQASGSFRDFKLGTYGFGGWSTVRSGEPAPIGGKVFYIEHPEARAFGETSDPAQDSSPPQPPEQHPAAAPVPSVVAAPPLRRAAHVSVLRLSCNSDVRCSGQASWPAAKPRAYSIAAHSSAQIKLALPAAYRSSLRARRTVRAKLVLRAADGDATVRRVRLRVRSGG